MELTTKQIEKIEAFLDDKGFHYVDLRMEILDHMMSDIEHKMKHNFSFESAFVMTKIRWEKHLHQKTSFYFGIQYSNFRIVINKAVKLFKPFFFGYFAAYFLPLIVLKNSTLSVSASTAALGNKLLFFLGVLGFFYFVYIFLSIRKQQKTTYSFVLRTQLLGGCIFLPLSVFLGEVFQHSGSLNPVFSGMATAGFSMVFITYYFYNKHQKALSKIAYL